MRLKLICVLFSLTLLSCLKKSWTCTCTNDVDGSIFEVSKYKLTESDAVSACENRDSQLEITCILEEN